eukprot:5760616-Prymnesium_polylepis.2
MPYLSSWNASHGTWSLAERTARWADCDACRAASNGSAQSATKKAPLSSNRCASGMEEVI